MSNLGWYQKITSASKKVGGPKNLIGITVGSSYILGIVTNYCYGKVKKEIIKSREEKKRLAEASIIYTVTKKTKSNEGLLFLEGDKFRVLEIDGDAALIEKIGDGHNPYFVSAKLLSRISDYHRAE